MDTEQKGSGDCRRSFLSKLGGVSALLMASGTGLPKIMGEAQAQGNNNRTGCHDGKYNGHARADEAYEIRVKVAKQERMLPIPPHPDNGDEERYYNKIGNFSKGLPHNHRGEVNLYAYNSLLYAMSTGCPSDFENIPLGSPPDQRIKLVNPQAALAFDLEGADSHALAIPPAPRLASAEEAAEMVEDYWMALCRDVSVNNYATDPIAIDAAHELSGLIDFFGPKVMGQVTPQTLFRVNVPGALVGPYFSQFLWKIPPFGATYVEPKMLVALEGIDYGTNYSEWLRLQNGIRPNQVALFDPLRRYIRNGRDISTWVHIDKLFESYFNALLIMLAQPANDPYQSGIGAPFNAGNPYLYSQNQAGFGTFGGENVLPLLCDVATRALKAQWFQKWSVHRRLRPEEYGGLVQLNKTYGTSYPLNAQVLNSQAVQQVYSIFGSYLLPLAYPEGCPAHPSYGAGHATVAGACVTILKAWFDEDFVIPDPVVASNDGLSLVPYTGQLTLGGELNKLASNIAIGRDHAGVHWRTDALASMTLGENIAISVMRDQKPTYNERFRGFTFTKFDGTTITV